MNAHKERPILFNGEMVRAILSGSKTKTRRIMKPQPEMQNVFLGGRHCNSLVWKDTAGPDGWLMHNMCPYGKKGDRLWVRETWQGDPHDFAGGITPIYAASDERTEAGWRPSIHMPRWASRITLEIVSVRLERLQAISEADAKAEGCLGGHGSIPGYAYNATPNEQFWQLFISIYGKAAWDENPWVWCLTFRRVEQ